MEMKLNSETDRIRVYVGSDGKLHFVNKAGADSVLPFSRTMQRDPIGMKIDSYNAVTDCIAIIHGSGGYKPWKMSVTLNGIGVITHTQSDNQYISFALNLSKGDNITLSYTGFADIGTGIDIFTYA